MTLTIHKQEDDQKQLQLTVEVSEARVEQAMREKARELARQVRVPGFRQGKAPYGVVLRRFGKETVRAEAIEDLVQPVFEEALLEADVESYGRPSLEDMEMDPLVLKFTVPLPPEVTLGNYRSIRKEIEPVEVTDEAVEEALEQVQIRHQNVEPVERAAEAGDIVTISGTGKFTSPARSSSEEVAEEAQESEQSEQSDEVDAEAADKTETSDADDVIFDEESIDLLLEKEKLFAGTPFVDNLIGLSVGDSTSFSLTFPEEFEQEEFAGRDAEFEITVLNVQQRDLPPLDDELAKLEGTAETLEELRSNIRENLERQAEDQAKEDLIDGMVHDMMEDAAIVYPPAAVEMEIDEMVESFKNQIMRSGWRIEDYLQIQGTTEEGLREDFRENAEHRLGHRLVLRQFILEEKLTVKPEDVDGLIEERVARFDNEELRQGMRDFYRSGAGFDNISSEVLSEKVYERIKAILSGEAPDLDALEEAEESATDEEE